MSTAALFRAGQHLIAGQVTNEGVGGVYHVEAQYRVDPEGGFRPLSHDFMEVQACCMVTSSFQVPTESILEAEAVPFAQVIHESLMPLVASMRRVDLHTSSLVAYERDRRGLGFMTEGEVEWYPLTKALAHQEFAQRLALEAHKPTLHHLGLWNRTRPEDIYEQSHVRTSPLHVYMKEGPFRDISKIHEGTDCWVTGYHRGCVIIEADGEEFWRPLEEAHFIPAKKDDWFYFSLDSDRNLIPDPLDFLPSKPALGTYPGSAASEDNWNTNPDLPRVAGNFRAVPWIPNEEHDIFNFDDDDDLEQEDDLAEQIVQGRDIDDILGECSRR